MNSDETVNEIASCGGLFRDIYRHWQDGFHKIIGHCNNLNVEFWGVITNLDFVWKKDFKRLIIQIDNKFVVEALAGTNLMQMHGSNLITRIIFQVRGFTFQTHL